MRSLITGIAALAGIVGAVVALTIVGIAVAHSGSWWPLTALLIVVVVAWCLPWEIFRERRRQRRAS
jgi:nitrate/nitrite transporter NarK